MQIGLAEQPALRCIGEGDEDGVAQKRGIAEAPGAAAVDWRRSEASSGKPAFSAAAAMAGATALSLVARIAPLRS